MGGRSPRGSGGGAPQEARRRGLRVAVRPSPKGGGAPPRTPETIQKQYQLFFSDLFFGHSSDTLSTRAYAAVMTRSCEIYHNSSKRRSENPEISLIEGSETRNSVIRNLKKSPAAGDCIFWRHFWIVGRPFGAIMLIFVPSRHYASVGTCRESI